MQKCLVCENVAKFKEKTNENNVYCNEKCQKIQYELVGIFGDDNWTAPRDIQLYTLLYTDPVTLVNFYATSVRMHRLIRGISYNNHNIIQRDTLFWNSYIQYHLSEILRVVNDAVATNNNLRVLQFWINTALRNGWTVTQEMIVNCVRFNFNDVIRIVGPYSNIQSLSVSNNQLTRLPESIGQLSNLQYLSVDNNELTKLPESIGQLSNLQGLYVSNNQLTELPESIGQLSNLQELNLNNNQLSIDDVPMNLHSILKIK